jgi:hypothetical protein
VGLPTEIDTDPFAAWTYGTETDRNFSSNSACSLAGTLTLKILVITSVLRRIQTPNA